MIIQIYPDCVKWFSVKVGKDKQIELNKHFSEDEFAFTNSGTFDYLSVTNIRKLFYHAKILRDNIYEYF